MDYELIKSNLDANQVSEIENLQNTLYDMKEEVERVNAEFDAMKFKFQQLMEEYGIDKIKNEYFTITYVPASLPTTKKVLDEEMVEKLIEELGMVKDQFYKDKTTSGRKAYIKWNNK